MSGGIIFKGNSVKPIAIDLFCGLGGWTEGLLAAGYDVIGYDITEHVYGDMRYPATLIVQDVLTLHGSQFKDAALIVASPPCQEYSYMALPWKRAKDKATDIRQDTTGESLARLNRLFNSCFRIQDEASSAAGRYIPLIVENVRGAQPWVGKARYNFGSFYLWGDVPALMPKPVGRKDGRKSIQDGLGGYGGSFGWNNTPMRRGNSSSYGRKLATATAAKIPLTLSLHVANVFLNNRRDYIECLNQMGIGSM